MKHKLLLGESHRINVGNYESLKTVTERKSVSIFREFTVAEIKEVCLSTMTDKHLRNVMQSGQITAFTPFRTLYPFYQSLNQAAPDIFSLFILLHLFNGDMLLGAFKERFTKLIEDNVDANYIVESTLFNEMISIGTSKVLALAILVAFTAIDRRNEIDKRVWQLRDHEYKRFINNIPDFTRFQTVKDRLFAFIRFLTVDYNDTLKSVYKDLGISLQEFNLLMTSDLLFAKKVHQRAGKLLAEQSLFGILSDRKNGGFDSVFKVHPKTHEGPILTERRQCPASHLTQVYLTGVGYALQEKSSWVLSKMTSKEILSFV